MPDEEGRLGPDDIETLNAFLNDKSEDEALTCPITGERVPIGQWNAPDRVLKLPAGGEASFDAVPLTSPSGGVLLISVVKLGL